MTSTITLHKHLALIRAPDDKTFLEDLEKLSAEGYELVQGSYVRYTSKGIIALLGKPADDPMFDLNEQPVLVPLPPLPSRPVDDPSYT